MCCTHNQSIKPQTLCHQTYMCLQRWGFPHLTRNLFLFSFDILKCSKKFILSNDTIMLFTRCAIHMILAHYTCPWLHVTHYPCHPSLDLTHYPIILTYPRTPSPYGSPNFILVSPSLLPLPSLEMVFIRLAPAPFKEMIRKFDFSYMQTNQSLQNIRR
jgi:hypothetical protein